jgi:hypothetical protein
VKQFDWHVLTHRLAIGVLGAVLALLQQRVSEPRDWAISILSAVLAAASYDQLTFRATQGSSPE